MRFNPAIKLDRTSYPTSPRFRDLSGMKFGRVTVVEFAGIKSKQTYYACVCDCGNTFVAYGGNLKRGWTRSCGCWHSERSSACHTIHGDTIGRISDEYRCWIQIKTRCLNPNYREKRYYSERGITVCDRWINGENGLSGFECFLADMGRKPSPKHSIERCENDKGYTHDNCVWATASEQARNKRHPEVERERDKSGRFK